MTTATLPLPTKVMTVDDFWDFVHRPENARRQFELHRGEVVEMSRPTRKHGAVSLNIGMLLTIFSRQIRKGYAVTNDAGVILEEDSATVVAPDVAYYTDAVSFEELPEKWGQVLPILAVEVLSPTDRMIAVNEKIEDYLRTGVPVVWLVDYEGRCVTVYRKDQNHQVIKEDGELSGGTELPGFTCRVRDLFRLPIEDDSSPQSAKA